MEKMDIEDVLDKYWKKQDTTKIQTLVININIEPIFGFFLYNTIV